MKRFILVLFLLLVTNSAMALMVNQPAEWADKHIMNVNETKSLYSYVYQRNFLQDKMDLCAWVLLDVQLGYKNELNKDSHDVLITDSEKNYWQIFVPEQNLLVWVPKKLKKWKISQVEFPY